jgi:hypothetical protein
VRAVLGLFGIGALFFLWVAAVSELVGLPVAWWKVRGTTAWRQRPRDVRGIDLLESYIRPIVMEAGLFALGVLVFLAALIWLLGLTGAMAAGIYCLVFVVPAILVAVAVSRLEAESFGAVVAAHRDRSP